MVKKKEPENIITVVKRSVLIVHPPPSSVREAPKKEWELVQETLRHSDIDEAKWIILPPDWTVSFKLRDDPDEPFTDEEDDDDG